MKPVCYSQIKSDSWPLWLAGKEQVIPQAAVAAGPRSLDLALILQSSVSALALWTLSRQWPQVIPPRLLGATCRVCVKTQRKACCPPAAALPCPHICSHVMHTVLQEEAHDLPVTLTVRSPQSPPLQSRGANPAFPDEDQRRGWEARAHRCIESCPRIKSQWLTPVTPAAQEAEIRRMVVQSQPGQRVHETPS
jgi:hypothetical protein